MSGGVDSSVVLGLLAKRYENLLGIFLYFWEDKDGEENKSSSSKSLIDARAIAKKFQITLYTLNFKEKFKNQIVNYFLEEYRKGGTPNPCVKCNKFIKLGALIERAKDLGYDYVATGHYARVVQNDGKYKLLRGVDETKDQSYFLYTLNQEQLSHLLFPLGGYRKDDVRKKAEKMNLMVSRKSDSQEICFITTKSHNDFLKKNLDLKEGDIFDMNNKKIGRHRGLPLYTIGQRKGIELGGDGPYYVAKFDYKKNILFVTNIPDDKVMYGDQFYLKDFNWISGKEEKMPFNSEVVIRYHHKGIKCLLSKKSGRYYVKLETPARAITPGQSAVFYNGEEVIGGGIITI